MYERAIVKDQRPGQPARDAGQRPRVVQRRLTVGRADDPAEREADAIAADVLARLRAGGTDAFDRPAGETRIQRAGGGDTLGGGELSSDEEREVHGAGGSATGVTGVLRRMEPAFGADFSSVRIHTGADVDVAADGLQARAFTMGHDVYIRRSDYRPGTGDGDELIAHELAHTLQQGGSRIRRRAVDPVEVREHLNGPHVSFNNVHLDFVRMKRKDTKIARMLTSKALGAMGAKALANGSPERRLRALVGGGRSPQRRRRHVAADEELRLVAAATVSIAETLKIDRVEGSSTGRRPGPAPRRGGRGGVPSGDGGRRQQGSTAPCAAGPATWTTFATGFKGSWNWRLAWGKNCHTFQDRMKKQLHLHNQTSKLSGCGPGGWAGGSPRRPVARALGAAGRQGRRDPSGRGRSQADVRMGGARRAHPRPAAAGPAPHARRPAPT